MRQDSSAATNGGSNDANTFSNTNSVTINESQVLTYKCLRFRI